MIYTLHNYRVTCDANNTENCPGYVDIVSMENNAHAAFQGEVARNSRFGWRSYALGFSSYGTGYCCPACIVPRRL